MHAASTYSSRVRDPALARIQASVDSQAPPLWRRVSSGFSFEWHDHRTHCTGHDPPPAVVRAPHDVHLIFRWRVPASADGKRFAVSGFLGYVPPPATIDGGTSPWLLAAAIGAALLAAAAIGAGVRRARRRTP